MSDSNFTDYTVRITYISAYPNLLLSLFNAQGEVLSIGKSALRIFSFVFPFSGTTLILGTYFQALGHSSKTLITALIQLGSGIYIQLDKQMKTDVSDFKATIADTSPEDMPSVKEGWHIFAVQ